MVLEQNNGFRDILFAGTASNRSVYSREQESSTVLFMDTSFAGLSLGCPVYCLAEHVCLCVFTYTTDSKSSESHEVVSKSTLILIAPNWPRQHWLFQFL